MKLLTIRELRNNPGKVWRELRREDLVLTANGRPIGILVGVEEDLEEALATVRRLRAALAVTRMRREAQESGRDKLTAEEIAAEVRAAREARPS
jgi:prevent-host-death family protein